MTQPPERRGARQRELPAGMADLLPGAAERFWTLRRAVLDVMALWGYRPVLPPVVEHAEVFAHALPGEEGEESYFRLVDRATGHVLSLRPDFTPQIARIAATRFSEARLPLRLCYEGPSIRHVPAQKGRRRELHQAGAELLGLRGPEGDAESIALLIDCLTAAGLSDFKVDVGQVEFFKGILADAPLPAALAQAITDAVARKDTSDLDRLLADAPLPDAKKRLLGALPLLAGGVEALDKADALVESGHSREALDNLRRVVEFLDAQGLSGHLTIDLGELRGVDYHTGVLFEAFVHHLGTPLCRGGRYDSLMAAFGRPCPATGFSIDLLAVAEAIALQAPSPAQDAQGVLLICRDIDRPASLALAARLRRAGIRACLDTLPRSPGEAAALAREERLAWLMTLETGAKSARLTDLSTGAEQTAPLDGIEALLTLPR